MSELMQETKARRRVPFVLIAITLFVIGAIAVFSIPAEDNAAGGKNTADNAAKDITPYQVGQMQKFVTTFAGKNVADFTFKDADGSDKSLADFDGKLVLVNFWATWCGPCRQEMPSLSRLQAAMGGDDFEVATISLDRKGISQIEPFFNALELTNLPKYMDSDNRSIGRFGLLGLPVTILVDRNGNEIGRITGEAEWDYEESQALISSQL